jgi:hypothetical protein
VNCYAREMIIGNVNSSKATSEKTAIVAGDNNDLVQGEDALHSYSYLSASIGLSFDAFMAG